MLRRSDSISEYLMKHTNNWDEQILDKCEELSVGGIHAVKNCKAVNSKDCRNSRENFEVSCNNKINGE